MKYLNSATGSKILNHPIVRVPIQIYNNATTKPLLYACAAIPAVIEWRKDRKLVPDPSTPQPSLREYMTEIGEHQLAEWTRILKFQAGDPEVTDDIILSNDMSRWRISEGLERASNRVEKVLEMKEQLALGGAE